MSDIEPSPEQILADALESRNAEAAALIRDGRRLRAERGRTSVVQATFDLIQEDVNPTIAEVAERAGISERTVFRYFADRDALMAAVAAEVFRMVSPLLVGSPPEGDLETRLRALIAHRVELVRIGGKFARSVEMSTPTSQLANELVSLRVDTLRAQLVAFLEPELSAAGPFARPIIDSMLSHRSMAVLRDQMDDDTTADALYTAISRILAN